MNRLLTSLLALLLPLVAMASDCRRVREVSPETEWRACPAQRVAEVRIRAVDPAAALAAGRQRLREHLGDEMDGNPLLLSGRPPHWRVGLLLPAEAPALAGEGLKIHERPARQVAALGFRGRWSTVRYAERQQALLRDLQKAGLTSLGSPWLARYPRRGLPDVLQRSEVLVEITPPGP